MIEQDVFVQTKYGRQASFAACPDGSGPFPGIILYMDAPGIREELRNMARRIAKHGYFCLLPDLYYRLGTLRFVAAHLPRIKAAASLYGVNIVTDKPDSPHLLLDRIQSELYFGFAEVDPSVPANVVSELQAALEKARTKHRLEVFPDTHHGFCFAARADYNAISAEAAWTRVFDLWERNLK